MVSFVVVGKLERRLGPYLLLFLVVPPLGGVAASAFFLPQQVSTAGCSALASLLGLLAGGFVRSLARSLTRSLTLLYHSTHACLIIEYLVHNRGRPLAQLTRPTHTLSCLNSPDSSRTAHA